MGRGAPCRRVPRAPGSTRFALPPGHIGIRERREGIWACPGGPCDPGHPQTVGNLSPGALGEVILGEGL